MTSLEEQLQALPQPYVVMGVGVPGSGKTTVLKEVAQHLNLVRISPDEIREELTGSAIDQSVNAEAWQEAYRRVELAIALGHSAIVDATHAEAWRRPTTIAQYRSYGAKAIVAAVFSTPLEVAKTRNAARDRIVPDYALERMHAALEQEPVTVAEGFDQVITVQT